MCEPSLATGDAADWIDKLDIRQEQSLQSGNGEGRKIYDAEGDAPSENSTNFVRLRGLPFSALESEVLKFLSGVNVESVTMTRSADGRPSGECYCELTSPMDVVAAINHHHEMMDNRYIEVFRISPDELSHLRGRGVINDEGKIVRLRGLPYQATVKDIKDFLAGLNCEEVVIGRTGGRPSGEAFVRLTSKEEAHKALGYNKQNMGTRYVEVFRTTSDDMDRNRSPAGIGGGPAPLISGGDYGSYPNHLPYGGHNDDGYGHGPTRGGYGSSRGGPRHAPYDRRDRYGGAAYAGGYGGYHHGGGGYDDFQSPSKVYMRGLPFNASEIDIERFFWPLKCMEIKIAYNNENRPSGDGCVEFSTMSEAKEALLKHNCTIGTRYVELFPSNDMPPNMKRVSWRTVGGRPGGQPQPLTNRGGPYAYGGYGYEDYMNSYGGGYGGYDGYYNGGGSGYNGGGTTVGAPLRGKSIGNRARGGTGGAPARRGRGGTGGGVLL